MRHKTRIHEHLKLKQALTVEDRFLMAVAQNHRCAICGSAKSLYVDHCHKTGKIRGLLCNSCNIGLGHLHDDPVRLRVALDYLLRNGG